MYLWWDTLSLWWDGILFFGRKKIAVPVLVIASCAEVSIRLRREPVVSGFAYAVDAKVCALNLDDEAIMLKLRQSSRCGILARINFPGPEPSR
jgi:hypothetical protein